MNKSINFIISINLFVHYPNAYNPYVISKRINEYFNKYFLNSKINFTHDCDVMINCAPHIEDESIIINVSLLKDLEDLIEIETFINDSKKIIQEYFNNRINNIVIKIIKIDN